MSFGDGCFEDAPRHEGLMRQDVYERQRDEIAALKARVLQRVILRVRAPYYCAKCHKAITRHAAQTEDGQWNHIGCLTRADSPHYHAQDVRVLGENWCCGCGHHNGPNMAVCSRCGRRPGETP